MNYHLIVLIDMQYIKNHKEETMPLRDENTKIRSIDDELKRLSEELGLVPDENFISINPDMNLGEESPLELV